MSPAAIDIGRGISVFCLLSVKGSLALDLLIAAYVISIFAIAVSSGDSILKVLLGVFRALEDFIVTARWYAFHIGFP